MKNLNSFIQEKLVINSKTKLYKYHPKTRDELVDIILGIVKKNGYGTKDNPIDLNCIDTSNIDNMSFLFDKLSKLRDLKYFDVSDWNVSNVKSMNAMFKNSGFNGDLSRWNTRSLEETEFMFDDCRFDGDISNWDMSNVKRMQYMFAHSDFSNQNGNINKWNVSKDADKGSMFVDTPLENHPPLWY